MAFYNTCSRCGASLDPGEHCDCEGEQAKQAEFFSQRMRANSRTGQYSMILEEMGDPNARKIAN